jgi:hypothetical protein
MHFSITQKGSSDPRPKNLFCHPALCPSVLPNPHPCRPLTSGPAGRRAGPAAIPLDRNAGGMRPRPSGKRTLIRPANLNRYRRHHRQSQIPAAPLTSGLAGRRAGPAAIPLDRKAGDERRPAPLAGRSLFKTLSIFSAGAGISETNACFQPQMRIIGFRS